MKQPPVSTSNPQVAMHRNPWDTEWVEIQKSHGVIPEVREPPPLQDLFGEEFVIDCEVDPQLLYTANHELNHLRGYVGEGGPPGAAKITTHPDKEQNSRGMMVFEGSHVSLNALSVTAMASSVPTTKGEVWGTGGDLVMAHVLHRWHGSISPEAARARAALHIRKNQEEWDQVGKALVYLQHIRKPPEQWTEGDKIMQIHDRVKYELREKKKRREESMRSPMQLDPRLGTEIRYLDNQPHVVEITYLIDQKVVNKLISCGICFHKNGHSEWCSTISKNNARVSEWSNIVRGLGLVKKDLLLDDLQEAGAILAGHYAYEEAKKVREEEEKQM